MTRPVDGGNLCFEPQRVDVRGAAATMKTLNARVNQHADELERAVRMGDTRGALRMLDEWGLSRDARLRVARELHRRLHLPADQEPVVLRFGRFDEAHLVKLGEAARRETSTRGES